MPTKNFASSTVATAPSPATSGTSLVVAAGEGVRFAGITLPFRATIWPAGAKPTPATAEVVMVTAIATDTLTISRAWESSTARTVVVGDQIAVTLTAAMFDSLRGVSGISMPNGWDECIGTALRLSGTADAYITLIGLSNGYGYGSTDYMANSWPSKLMVALDAAGFDYGGDFWPTYFSAVTNGWANVWAGTPPWVFNSATNLSWFSGGYGKTTVYTAANATMPCMTFVIPAGYACTDMEILYYGISGGNFDYRVDGGTVRTVTGAAGPQRVTTPDLSGLNPANAHTVEIGNFTLGGGLAITGIWTKKRSSGGVHIARLCGPSFELCLNWGLKGTDTFAQGAKPAPNRAVSPPDLCLQMQGYTSGASNVASNANATNFGFPAKPHLTIIEAVANDLINNRGRETMRGVLRRLGYAVRRGRDNASILYLIPAVGAVIENAVASTDPSYDSVAGIDNGQNWPVYREVIADFAQNHYAAYVDLQKLWSEQGVTKAYQTTSDFHPTDTGHQYIADLLASIFAVNTR